MFPIRLFDDSRPLVDFCFVKIEQERRQVQLVQGAIVVVYRTLNAGKSLSTRTKIAKPAASEASPELDQDITATTAFTTRACPRLATFYSHRAGCAGSAFKMQSSQAAQKALRATSRTSSVAALQRRSLSSDVMITRTGKPIIRHAGGRSSLGGYTATVFGATGFLGRYIVNRLARKGCQVVVPYREEMSKRHLKPTGDLGRVVFMEWDARNTQSIEESVRHSDIVFNLVGRNYPTKRFSLMEANVESTERIAEAVAKYDIDRFIHVSSYNADENSPSEFFRAKVRLSQT